MAPHGVLQENMSSDSFKLYDLRVTVVEIRGRSVCGLTVGDWFEVRNSSQLVLPPNRHFCIYALASVIPLLPAKQRELSENDWLASDSLVACPDPEERLIMKIERLAPLDPRKSNLRERGPKDRIAPRRGGSEHGANAPESSRPWGWGPTALMDARTMPRVGIAFQSDKTLAEDRELASMRDRAHLR